MSTNTIIIGIALGVLLAAAIILLRNRPRDVFAVILVAGIAALAIAVNIDRVQQYWQQAGTAAAAAQKQPEVAVNGMPTTPPAPPPVAVPVAPLIKGPTGGAAPEAAQNPYLRRS